MESERRHLQQRLVDFYIAYYSELRKGLPNYVSDPESRQIPPHLRTHHRCIRVMEFEDGYVIAPRTVPEEEFHQVGYWEAFYFWDYRGQTIGAATERGYPPYSDFMEGEMPLVRNTETGEYAEPMPPENIESRDLISKNGVAMLTQDMAPEEARKNLREILRDIRSWNNRRNRVSQKLEHV